jgi:hypothetical protein
MEAPSSSPINKVQNVEKVNLKCVIAMTEEHSLKGESDRKIICKAFRDFLKRNKITHDMLKKKIPVYKDILRIVALGVFGEIKNKHIIALQRMYTTNFLNIQDSVKVQCQNMRKQTKTKQQRSKKNCVVMISTCITY